jgi:hypothetical protein
MSGSYRAQDPCLIAPYGEQIALTRAAQGNHSVTCSGASFTFLFKLSTCRADESTGRVGGRS